MTKGQFQQYLKNKGYKVKHEESELLMNPDIYTKESNGIYREFLFYPENGGGINDLFLYSLSENKSLSEIIPHALGNSDVQMPCQVSNIKVYKNYIEFSGAKIWI